MGKGLIITLLEIADFAYDLLSPTPTQGPEADAPHDSSHSTPENSHAQAPETHPEVQDPPPSNLDNSHGGQENVIPDSGIYDDGVDSD